MLPASVEPGRAGAGTVVSGREPNEDRAGSVLSGRCS
jgi:hypothetical protein